MDTKKEIKRLKKLADELSIDLLCSASRWEEICTKEELDSVLEQIKNLENGGVA